MDLDGELDVDGNWVGSCLVTVDDAAEIMCRTGVGLVKPDREGLIDEDGSMRPAGCLLVAVDEACGAGKAETLDKLLDEMVEVEGDTRRDLGWLESGGRRSLNLV